MNTCIFLVLIFTLDRRLRTVLQIFKHVVGSLRISHLKYVKLFKVFFSRKKFVFTCLVTQRGGGILTKVTNGGYGGGESKLGIFMVMSFLNGLMLHKLL